MIVTKFSGKLCLALLTLVLLSSALFAQDDEVDLSRIVVTPYRYGESLAKTAADVTVVTEEEIEGSNAQNITDVLKSISGIVVKDIYGNGAKTSVDIGGFGEQSALNVLVLVDGRRVNDVDLSGVDWSQVPLDQVERIEVVRGGSGAVLYGDNASSGVINIITKKGSGKPKVNLEAEYGSYAMNKQKLSVDGGLDNKLSYWLSGSRQSTNGYRKNTFNNAKDFSSKVSYDFTDILSAHFDSGFHDSSYGLPGALFQGDIDKHNRRYAPYGDDHVNNKDYYFVVGAKSEFPKIGDLNIDFSYRKKNTEAYFLSSGNPTQRNKIETFGLTPKYTISSSILGRENKFVTGLDYYRVFYNSSNYDKSNESTLKSYTNVNKTSLAGYLQDELSILEQLSLVGGYRYEIARYTFGYHDASGWNPDQDKKTTPIMEVFNAGLVYTYKDDSNIFLNIGRSFRFPEVDEFNYTDASYQQQLNTNLKPQKALNYQVGIRHNFFDRFKGSFSLFRMDVKNEIYYNATDNYSFGYWDGKTDNYDRTVHEGFEASVEAKLSSRVTSYGNYTFTNAYFDGGQYNNNDIPLVPHHKATVGLKFILPSHFTLNVTGNYVGKRYFMNDQANAYSRLNGYMVADTNLCWSYKDVKVTFGINNLFNKQYSEYAGVLQGYTPRGYPVGDKFYYPSPERNFILKANYTF